MTTEEVLFVESLFKAEMFWVFLHRNPNKKFYL